MDKEIATYRSLTFADSTKRSYASHKRSYLSFCLAMGYPPVPVSQVNLARYSAFLARRLSPNSINKYLNIIRILHLELGFPDPLKENWMLNTVLKGVARLKGLQIHRKLPISPSLLLGIRKRLNLGTLHDSVFWAICLVAFFAFFRKSNLLPPSNKTFDPTKHLCRRDITIFRGGIQVQVRWSKTIQFAERLLYVPLPDLGNHPLCPVRAVLHAFAFTRGAPLRGSAFVLPTKTGWTSFPPSRFIKILRAHIKALGLKGGDYSGHSFRRGAASWALQNGLPGEIIKILGDWKSDTYLNYLSLDHCTKFESISRFASGLPRF